MGDSSLQRDTVASHGTLLFRALWRHNGRELCCRGWVSRGQWPSHLLRWTHVLQRTGEELTDFIEPGILEHLLDDFPICYWSSSLRLWAMSCCLRPGRVWAQTQLWYWMPRSLRVKLVWWWWTAQQECKHRLLLIFLAVESAFSRKQGDEASNLHGMKSLLGHLSLWFLWTKDQITIPSVQQRNDSHRSQLSLAFGQGVSSVSNTVAHRLFLHLYLECLHRSDSTLLSFNLEMNSSLPICCIIMFCR